jgi:leucyl-tRNA synthetase
MWAALGHEPAVANAGWPKVEAALLVEDTITAVVQIKGKVRARLEVPVDITAEDLEALALADEGVIRYLDGAAIAKVIVRAPKLVNVVPAS